MARTEIRVAPALWLALLCSAPAAWAKPAPAPIIVNMAESIQAAINDAKPGDVVEVIGYHNEPVTMRSGVTLRAGANSSMTCASGPVIRMENTRDAVVEGMHVSKPNTSEVAAIEIRSATGTIRGCTIDSQGDAIAVRGASRVFLTDNRIPFCGGIGIRLAGHTQGTITNNKVWMSTLHGIAVLDDATPSLSQNQLNFNHHAGLAYFGRAGGLAENNLCSHNESCGILLAHQAGPTLRHNTLLSNQGPGLNSTSTGACTVVGNLIARNHVGIKATPPLAGLRGDANLVGWSRDEGTMTQDEPRFTASDKTYVLARADGAPDDRFGWQGPGINQGLAARPKDPPLISVEASFHDASGDGILSADESATLDLAVTNRGKGRATRIIATCGLAEPVAGLYVPPTLTIGDLQPGESRTVKLPVSSRTSLANGKATLSLTLEDAYGFDAPLIKTTFATRPFQRPALAVGGVSIVDTNGNGVLERGEQADLVLRIANSGAGLARGVTAKLMIGDPRIKSTADDAVALGDLSPGASKEVRYSILVLNRYEGPQSLPLSVAVQEAHPEFGVTTPLQLALDRAAPTTIERVVEARSPVAAPAPEEDELAVKRAAAPANPNAYALIIGVERYNQNLPQATFARRDAAAFRRFCEQSLGVPAENAIVLTDDQATGGNIRTALEGQLTRWTERGKSDLYVYFAGHGAPDAATKSAFLVPYDGNPSYPGVSCYSLSAAYDALARLGAHSVTVVLDSCFSGQSGRAEKALALSPNLRPLFIEAADQAVPAGLTVFAAATGSQTSSAFGAKRHGLFTYYFLKGLQGDADADKDHRVTVGELRAYLSVGVPREARRLNLEQTPTVKGEDARVLVTLP